MTEPLVWIPFDPAQLGEMPPGLRFEVVDPRRGIPASVGEVEVYVLPFAMEPALGAVIAQMTSLRVIQTMSAGVDLIRRYVPEGVTLCRGGGVHDAATAEMAVALALADLRNLPTYVRQQERHDWTRTMGGSLADQRVMVLGYGSIGQAIERRLKPFEVEVVRVARTARDGVHAFTELLDLLPSVDVVIVIVPATSETRGLVDAEFLGRLKDGALLVNVARGEVVVTDALVAELQAGRLHAALDVTDPEPLPADHPLWDAPNTLIVPHVGGASPASFRRAVALVADQLRRYATGQPLQHVTTGEY